MLEAKLQVDEILLPLLQVSDESESQRLIAKIISEHADSVIRDIIKYKLWESAKAIDSGRLAADAEDIYHDALTQLLDRLNSFRADPERNAISQLRSYIAVITYHCCYRYLRQVYPQRHILKNRLRYLLTRQTGFSLWESADKKTLCGFAAWRGRGPQGRSDRITQLLQQPEVLEQVRIKAYGIERAKPADLIASVFTFIEGPIALDDLVKIAARLWGIKDQEPIPEPDMDEYALPAREQGDPGAQMDRRDYLQKLWREVYQLPLGQRAAILLNLRGAEGRGCIELFQFAGVATIGQIAEALEIPMQQFAALWNELPLDDLAIAKRLGLNRQQVINLRKSARARLARRMKNLE